MEAQPNSYGNELKNELIELLKVVVQKPEINNEQCIYKVPPKIRQVNPQAYTPQVISIGPLHNNNLHEMEELKLKYFKGFLDRTNLCVDNLVFKVQEWENKIRNCYEGPISFDSKDFLKIIIVDACFIIEHFLRIFNSRENGPILLNIAQLDDIIYDLILLENQLPFFVLEEIYKLANINLEPPPFITITVFYFQYFNQHKIDSKGLHPKHFTDLLRTFLLPLAPPSFDFAQEGMENTIDHLYSVSQLSEAGLIFEVSESKCLFDMKFDKGVLKMPCFLVHDETEMHMRNIITFEECHRRSFQDPAYISQYFTILDYLINTEKDVSILVDKKIIVNSMGDANEVATMVNNLCKNITDPKLTSEYVSLCHRLNGFYENPRNKYKAIFVHEYFNTPWKIASTITALLLVLFTLIQTICSIWSLVK